ncbi:hypothetical protein [Pseudomonas aeruginosa]|uniref:hypothetical protein n=1 Tax=Pseudomonas aeruginosa TaxID=287 RepID=UPI0013A57865|nr:hypothetical protein [Pseudomonas aeruginosa]
MNSDWIVWAGILAGTYLLLVVFFWRAWQKDDSSRAPIILNTIALAVIATILVLGELHIPDPQAKALAPSSTFSENNVDEH